MKRISVYGGITALERVPLKPSCDIAEEDSKDRAYEGDGHSMLFVAI